MLLGFTSLLLLLLNNKHTKHRPEVCVVSMRQGVQGSLKVCDQVTSLLDINEYTVLLY